MNALSTIAWRFAATLALVAALAAISAASALADPPNYPRHLPQATAGLGHEPEIVSGLAGTSIRAEPVRVPEIVSGIASPVSAAQPVSLGQPEGRGFDWGDAGIGAGAAFAAVLLTAGCALALRRRASLAH